MFAGAIPSLSVTAEARIVTVHVSPGVKSAVGSIVNELSPALVTPACEPLAPHEIVNQSAAVVTASLKLTVMFALVATLVAPFEGDVEVTDGALSRPTPSQACGAVATLRGAGAAELKSAALLSVSVQP